MLSTSYRSNTSIYVALEKKVGTIFPKLQLKYIGENAIFQCLSHGMPKWIKDGKVIPSVYHNPFVLIIRHVTEYNTGFYTCSGTYQDGIQFQARSRLVVGSKSC